MEAKLNERLMEWLMERPASAPRAQSEHVEIVPAEQQSRRLYFIMNHGATAERVTLPPGARDVLNGTALTGEMNLGAYDVAMIACDG
jgi:beta-galactosidase GanA